MGMSADSCQLVIVHRRGAKDAEGYLFLLSADPARLQRDRDAGKQKDPAFELIPLHSKLQNNKGFQMLSVWNLG